MSKKEFEEISIPKWKLAIHNTAAKAYRVFKSAEEFDMVEAESASEAFAKSGLEDVYKIEFGAGEIRGNIDQSMLEEVVEAVEAATEEAPGEEASKEVPDELVAAAAQEAAQPQPSA